MGVFRVLQNSTIATGKFAPCKNKQVTAGYTQNCFDGEALEKLGSRDNHFKVFQKKKLHINKEYLKRLNTTHKS